MIGAATLPSTFSMIRLNFFINGSLGLSPHRLRQFPQRAPAKADALTKTRKIAVLGD
jgi:hypothetical protein